jgi:hypothetical protein
VSGTDFTLNSVTLPVSQATGSASNLRVRIASDAAGIPGATLEVLSENEGWPPFSNPFTTTTTLSSTLAPVLSAGTTYWIVTEPTSLSNGDYRWFFNTEGDTGLFAQEQASGELPDGSSWNPVSSPPIPTPALRVEGDLVVGPGVDQWNRVSTGNTAVISGGQTAGQTFTVGITGLLSGVEFAPLLDSSDPSDEITLEVFDSLGQSLGSTSITAEDFPPGSGVVPAPLSLTEVGPGFFDTASLGIQVQSGEALSFEIRRGEATGVCDQNTSECSSGRVGEFCFVDSQCDQSIRAGTSGDTYAGGTRLVNGLPSTGDLAFKTFVSDPTGVPALSPSGVAILAAALLITAAWTLRRAGRE